MHLTLKTTVSNSGFLLEELFQISLPIGVVKKTVVIVRIVEKVDLNLEEVNPISTVAQNGCMMMADIQAHM